MPSPNPTTRREYQGAAAATTLQTGIGAGDSSFTLIAANNWPTGAVGNFIVTIDRGQSNEERILCSAQAARVVTVAGSGRGFDGTSAASHATGATVECTLSGFDADEWNAHTNATTGVHGVAGAAVGTTDTQTLTNKTLTSPTINGGALNAASTIGGVSGTTLAAERGAWTTFTPTWTAAVTNPTIGNGTILGRYMQIGKAVYFYLAIVFGTTTTAGSGQYSIGLPVTPNTGIRTIFPALVFCAGTTYTATGFSGGAFLNVLVGNTSISGNNPGVWAATNHIEISGVYEAA